MIAPGFRALPPSASRLEIRDILAGLAAWPNRSTAQAVLAEAVRRRFGVRHVLLFSSGRAALWAGLRALGQLAPERNEVLLPAFTAFSVPSAVVRAGLRISLYDLDPWTLTPDLASLGRAVTGKTLCLVACRLFGYPVDVRPLREMARNLGLPLVDDAAQAMGAGLDGLWAGTQGDFGLFSLGRGKNMTAVGGGLLLTDRDDLAAVLTALPGIAPVSFFSDLDSLVRSVLLSAAVHPELYWLPASLPLLNIGASIFDPDFSVSGLDGFRAGMAGRVFGRLDRINAGRRAVAAQLLAALAGAPGVRAIRPVSGAEPVFLRLPLLPGAEWPGGLAPQCPALGVVRSYPLPVHRIGGLAPYLAARGTYPGAEFLARNLVTAPTHSFVRAQDVAAMVRLFQGQEVAA